MYIGLIIGQENVKPMGKTFPFDLTLDEATSLVKLAVSKEEPRIAKRAKVVLCAATGMSLREIQARVGLGWQSCLKWRKRFWEKREKGLLDEPRKGRPAIFDVEAQQEVINKVLSSTSKNRSNRWSFRKLASATGLSKSTIHRVLSELSFKPQKVNYWHDRISAKVLKSKKPYFLGFYFSRAENAVAFSQCNKQLLIARPKDSSGGKRDVSSRRRILEFSQAPLPSASTL